MYEKNVRIIPSHQDVFGLKSKSELQIIEILKEFHSLAILHMCTKLMLFLNSSGSHNPTEQTKLAKGLLCQNDCDRLQAFIDARDEDDSSIVIFHHVPVMMLIKLNLEHNDKTGLNIDTEEARTKFASILISLCDIWLNDGRFNIKSGDKRVRRYVIEGFRALQAAQLLQENNSEPMINLLARGRYLIDGVRMDIRLNFDSVFESSVGLKLSVYLDILLMIMVQWTVIVDVAKLDEESVRSTGKFFENTTLCLGDIDKFLDIVGFDMECYKEINKKYLGLINMPNDKTHNNFITFMNKPILRYEDKFLCLSPNFLSLQLTDGPYNIVREALKGTIGEKLLPIILGDVYERYIIDRLSSAFGKLVYKKPDDGHGNEMIDLVIDLGDVVIVVEIKYPHWSFKARITGKRADMHGYMNRIARYNPKKEALGFPPVNKKKGLGQIKYFIEQVDSGALKSPVSLEDKIIIPLLIVGEEYPCDPMNRDLLEDYASNEGCLLLRDKRISPFVLLNSEEVELIESLVEELGIEKTKEILISYIESLKSGNRSVIYTKRPTSFKNEVMKMKITVPNNQFIKQKSRESLELVRGYFQKGEEKINI